MTGSTTIPLPHIGGPANAALAEANIHSLNDLAHRTEREVAALHGMGPKGIRILKAALAEHELAFAPRATTPSPDGAA